MLKKLENNGTEEIGLVTPTPGPHMFIFMGIEYTQEHLSLL